MSDYDFALDEALIAQHPIAERSASRLMVMRRGEGTLEHAHFYELPRYLSPGDMLIANDSRVIPARLFGVKRETGGTVEVLLLRPLAEGGVWETLVRPGRRVRSGTELSFGDGELLATVIGVGEGGIRRIRFSAVGDDFDRVLDTLGEMPLPPYIRERLTDRERYQTVYSRAKGSVAAPTAGLHFTPELLETIRGQGVDVRFLTLHVGLGTFRPVQAARIEDHHMHAEWFRVSASLLDAIAQTRASGGRVVAVGTTTVRALESAVRMERCGAEVAGWTDIFIYPGFQFHAINALITNFHLPKSTLLMLVAALMGREPLLEAYDTAQRERYRFFSFGDAMLIL